MISEYIRNLNNTRDRAYFLAMLYDISSLYIYQDDVVYGLEDEKHLHDQISDSDIPRSVKEALIELVLIVGTVSKLR